MQTEILEQLEIKTKQKTVYPKINSILIEFNLELQPWQIHDFREAILRCISNPDEKEVFSNERWEKDSKKTIVRYPLVQFRTRNGHAAIWAMQGAVPLLHKFMEQYKKGFAWQGKKFPLLIAQLPIETKNYAVKIFNPKLRVNPVVYHLYYYIPFINGNKNRNYDWFKDNRNLPDIEKTRKLQELMTSHICSFIHYSGGFIPKEKIKLIILDKKLLENVSFEGREHAAYEIRYTVNVNLPDFIGIGNKCSHGFGWQRLE